jgi:hypothetical protein
MAQQRETATDRLISIITTIKLERQSGQLRVRRGEGLTSEEGILTFVKGQITQANVGRRNGADAVNWLSTWGQAYYIFFSAGLAVQPVRDVLTPPPISAAEEENVTDRLVARTNTDKLGTEAGVRAPSVCMPLSEALARIEQSGLSRTHRRLFLLIDGRRSEYELATLLGKKVEEMRDMLLNLEWLGIIHLFSS